MREIKINSHKIQYLAVDLDGTLTNSDKEITEETRQSLWKAMQKGVRLILASGRPTIGVMPVALQLKLKQWNGFILSYNGGQIIECRTGTVIYEKRIPVSLYEDICKIARKFNLSALTYDQKGLVCESDSAEYVKKEAFNNGIEIFKVRKLEQHIKKEVVKFMIVGRPEAVSRALPVLQKRFRGGLNVFLSEPYFIELVPLHVEKAAALDWLIRRLGGSREDVMAIGDGLNDIPMLRYAGVAVAMGNAYKETKEWADYITCSNNENGVARAVDAFILEQENETRVERLL